MSMVCCWFVFQSISLACVSSIFARTCLRFTKPNSCFFCWPQNPCFFQPKKRRFWISFTTSNPYMFFCHKKARASKTERLFFGENLDLGCFSCVSFLFVWKTFSLAKNKDWRVRVAEPWQSNNIGAIFWLTVGIFGSLLSFFVYGPLRCSNTHNPIANTMDSPVSKEARQEVKKTNFKQNYPNINKNALVSRTFPTVNKNCMRIVDIWVDCCCRNHRNSFSVCFSFEHALLSLSLPLSPCLLCFFLSLSFSLSLSISL